MNETLCYNVREGAVSEFLSNYPAVRGAMTPYVELYCAGYGSLLACYNRWLEETENERNSGAWGAAGTTRSSEAFGTKTFWNYEWNGCGGWAEVYEYLVKEVI